MTEFDEMKHSINLYFVREFDGGILDSIGELSSVPLIEFGNTVPNAGDFVCSPFQDGMIFEVKRRYFRPKEYPREQNTAAIGGGFEKVNHVAVFLVVEERPTNQNEAIFGYGG